MNLFRMQGGWGRLETALYERFVTPGAAPLYDRLAALMLQHLPPDALVLDVGCGAGPVACRLARGRPDVEVRGVDLSPEMIRRAREHAERERLANVAFDEGDAQALDEPSARYSLCYSVASVKHWPDPLRGVAEMARVVRPDGLVAVFEADREAGWDKAMRFGRLWRVPRALQPIAGAYFHQFVAGQGVTAAELERWLIEAGLGGVLAGPDDEMPIVASIGVR